MTTEQGTPRHWAARDSDNAWLPLEWVATPSLAWSSSRLNTALVAPRTLKAPAFCRFSHLNSSVAPVCASNVALVSTGVRCIQGAILSWAAQTSANVGMLSLVSCVVDMAFTYCGVAILLLRG